MNYYEGVPYIDEASKVLICKKMFAQTMKPEGFVMKEIDDKFYRDKDYHDLYIGGITHILTYGIKELFLV